MRGGVLGGSGFRWVMVREVPVIGGVRCGVLGGDEDVEGGLARERRAE